MIRRTVLWFLAALTLLAAGASASAAEPTLEELKEKLGKNLYFDIRLSNPAGQSCASCHSPGAGFNGFGDASIPVIEGAKSGRFGNRNPPSAAYASFNPRLEWVCDGGDCLWIGGQFWDGRVNTLAEQAGQPFLNPKEMNTSKREVVAKVIQSNYVDLFIKVYGAKTLPHVEKAFAAITDAIAAYESSAEVNRFSSKYDWYLKDPVQYPLSMMEKKGLELFNRPDKGNCAACHPSAGVGALFTDHSYDNIGVPKNGVYEGQDLGLGAFKDGENGKFKVPTLRNVAVAPPYSHNGYFKTLKEIVHFYNTRDVAPGGGMGGGGMGGGGMGGGGMGGGMASCPGENWPAPEVDENVNSDELGKLGLTCMEEDMIVAFLMTLTDGYAPPNPLP